MNCYRHFAAGSSSIYHSITVIVDLNSAAICPWGLVSKLPDRHSGRSAVAAPTSTWSHPSHSDRKPEGASLLPRVPRQSFDLSKWRQFFCRCSLSC